MKRSGAGWAPRATAVTWIPTSCYPKTLIAFVPASVRAHARPPSTGIIVFPGFPLSFSHRPSPIIAPSLSPCWIFLEAFCDQIATFHVANLASQGARVAPSCEIPESVNCEGRGRSAGFVVVFGGAKFLVQCRFFFL